MALDSSSKLGRSRAHAKCRLWKADPLGTALYFSIYERRPSTGPLSNGLGQEDACTTSSKAHRTIMATKQ